MDTKRCSTCKKELPLTAFSKCRTNKDGYQNVCKVCKKIYAKAYREKYKDRLIAENKAWKEANPDKVKGYTKVVRKRYKQKWQEFLHSIMDVSCSKCGYSECFAALDFHHTGKKNFAIAPMLQQKPSAHYTELVRKELENCIILCARCHREHHAGYES